MSISKERTREEGEGKQKQKTPILILLLGAVSNLSPQQWRQQLQIHSKGVAAAAGKLGSLGVQPQNMDRTGKVKGRGECKERERRNGVFVWRENWKRKRIESCLKHEKVEKN